MNKRPAEGKASSSTPVVVRFLTRGFSLSFTALCITTLSFPKFAQGNAAPKNPINSSTSDGNLEADLKAIEILMNEVVEEASEEQDQNTQEVTNSSGANSVQIESQGSSEPPNFSPVEEALAANQPAVVPLVTEVVLQKESFSLNTNPTADSSASNQNTSSSAANNDASQAQVSESFFQTKSSYAELGGDIWKTTAAIFGILLLVALASYQWIRRRQAGLEQGLPKVRPLQILATLPVGPKRQILLIRVKDQEIAVASTEQGIQMLSNITQIASHPMAQSYAHQLTQNTLASASSEIRSMPPSHLAEALAPQLTSQEQDKEGSIQHSQRIAKAKTTTATSRQKEVTRDRGQSGTKSEILRKALETIENRKKTATTSPARQSHSVTMPEQPAPKRRPVKQTALPQRHVDTQTKTHVAHLPETDEKRPALPTSLKGQPESNLQKKANRNLSNLMTKNFETEAARAKTNPRSDSRSPIEPQTAPHSEKRPDSTERRKTGTSAGTSDNVAQLIREKLKQMRSVETP